jgi:hypothetical protein
MVFGVQLQKVAVSRNNDALLLDRVPHVVRIGLRSQTNVTGRCHIVPATAQQVGDGAADVLVQVETELLLGIRAG